ncbi:hypothetical protein M427DRAFT_210907 [Gonapodya prolifera JEL478]|uniref:Uncharacterized protein n=1 Tax=Gonapodya prolifera (strain JEL478) TaxID=1344416 RepID=A0A139ANX0_GONPJ|nr:hypothetical protein M427DRAFT_210907 [Gonapodya prolifera JEL478]|eukprot:KXS18457.1 hypothetical protein M427DRAFT_210907 [Gonapodya prolifera JEL478]
MQRCGICTFPSRNSQPLRRPEHQSRTPGGLLAIRRDSHSSSNSTSRHHPPFTMIEMSAFQHEEETAAPVPIPPHAARSSLRNDPNLSSTSHGRLKRISAIAEGLVKMERQDRQLSNPLRRRTPFELLYHPHDPMLLIPCSVGIASAWFDGCPCNTFVASFGVSE